MPAILFLSSDQQLISTMQTACQKAAMSLTLCSDAKHASGLLKRRKFYAALVDNTDAATTSEFLGAVRESTSSKTAVSVVFAEPPARGISDAAMVVTKPVSPELALRTLRAAQGSMTNEFRRYVRHAMRSAVTLTVSGKREIHATSVNISDGGLELRLIDPESLSTGDRVKARFILPVSGDWVQVVGDVIWCEPSGRAGLRFSGITPGDCDRLRNWLAGQTITIH